ncbi:protein FAR1-RELATED SEQUENCE 1-like [Juglans regia]|uniref:Protein FAR1-RELATED SEQUENCE n=1 Tax=Juglans regia TaxID=51240 RepID=A0A6P9E1V4_JUGRE|nr:protein FAR1-RELATED SEQUENCE 1-like [Juglans regia]
MASASGEELQGGQEPPHWRQMTPVSKVVVGDGLAGAWRPDLVVLWQRMLDLNDRADIRMNKNFGVLVVDARGFENLDFQEKYCRNFIDKAKQLRLGKGGGETLTDYFKRMRLINDGFVSVVDVDVDEDLRIRNVFWLTHEVEQRMSISNMLSHSIQHTKQIDMTCVEFEEKWGQLIQKYDLGDNARLQGLYNERSFWVPAYLMEFINQFDDALRKKVEVETTGDFMSCNQTIPCASPFHIEKQFQTLYTNAKYKEVQKEMLGAMCCNCLFLNKECCISTFDVLDEITIEDDHVKTVKYTIYYNEEECELKCTCALFEMKGILCRHALKVCQMKKIHSIPKKYVLDRWRKDLNRRYTLVKSSYDDMWQNTDPRRYEVVVKRCLKLATRVSKRDDHVNAFMCHLNKFDNNFKRLPLESGSTKVRENVVADNNKKILSPYVVRGKGRPTSKRKVPPVEKAATKKRKK